MRPFLFTAESEWTANNIADVVCLHYAQIEVMLYVSGHDVQFRKKRKELEDVYEFWLYPNRPSFLKRVFNYLQKALRRARVARNV